MWCKKRNFQIVIINLFILSRLEGELTKEHHFPHNAIAQRIFLLLAVYCYEHFQACSIFSNQKNNYYQFSCWQKEKSVNENQIIIQ